MKQIKVETKKSIKKSISKALKKYGIITGLSLTLLTSGAIAFAQGSWANAQTFNVDAWSGWNGVNTLGQRLGNTKQTTSNRWDVHTISRTMSSSPNVRLVNSGGTIRGNSMSTASVGRTVEGSQTGEAGFAYFIQVHPALNQVTNNQSIRLQHRAR